MIVNIRGTSGSGKTTAVRALLRRAERAQAIYGVHFGFRMPEAHTLRLAGIEQDVSLIGPYRSDGCDGCDRVQPFELIPRLIEKYAAQGHVIFEGLLISTMDGVIGKLLERRGPDAVSLFLSTPVETCVERVNARRRERGNEREFDPRLTERKHATVARVRAKFEERGMRALTVNDQDAADKIIKLFQQCESAHARHWPERHGSDAKGHNHHKELLQ